MTVFDSQMSQEQLRPSDNQLICSAAAGHRQSTASSVRNSPGCALLIRQLPRQPSHHHPPADCRCNHRTYLCSAAVALCVDAVPAFSNSLCLASPHSHK
jgi:hypothetical protein